MDKNQMELTGRIVLAASILVAALIFYNTVSVHTIENEKLAIFYGQGWGTVVFKPFPTPSPSPSQAVDVRKPMTKR